MAANLKYRPKDFKDIVGNQSVVKSLESMFEKGDIPQAFLFTGPAGCGKTTVARILKDKLDCKDMDFREYNMSNNRGIDTAREMISTAPMKPMAGEVKIYLLDEVHKATKDFQNALLKLLEEPPAHVYFLLCTTDPQQLIKTIISRCSVYSMTSLAPRRMKRLMDRVVKKEKAEISEEVMDKLIEHAGGEPRKALVIFDQIKNIEEEELQLQAVSNIVKDEKQIIDLCKAFIEGKKWKTISAIIEGIDAEPETVRRAVLGYFTKVLLNKGHAQAAIIIECFEDNYYDSGRAGLVLSCFNAVNG